MIDSGLPGGDQIQDIKSREEDLKDDIGKAEVLEREHLDTSRVCVGDHGTFAVVTKALKPWESKKSRSGASDRSFTVGDKIRQQLLQGRKYLGTKKDRLFALIIYSCIGLFLSIEKHTHRAIVKAEIKPPGQRNPHVWAREALLVSNGSWITVGFSRYVYKGCWETCSYVTSNLLRDVYTANSFVHWMEREDITEIITRPRQFVVVSLLTKPFPRGIPGAWLLLH